MSWGCPGMLRSSRGIDVVSSIGNLSYLCLETISLWHGVKVRPGPQNPGPQDPRTRDPGHPKSLKVGSQDPLQNLPPLESSIFKSLKVELS